MEQTKSRHNATQTWHHHLGKDLKAKAAKQQRSPPRQKQQLPHKSEQSLTHIKKRSAEEHEEFTLEMPPCDEFVSSYMADVLDDDDDYPEDSLRSVMLEGDLIPPAKKQRAYSPDEIELPSSHELLK